MLDERLRCPFVLYAEKALCYALGLFEQFHVEVAMIDFDDYEVSVGIGGSGGASCCDFSMERTPLDALHVTASERDVAEGVSGRDFIQSHYVHAGDMIVEKVLDGVVETRTDGSVRLGAVSYAESMHANGHDHTFVGKAFQVSRPVVGEVLENGDIVFRQGQGKCCELVVTLHNPAAPAQQPVDVARPESEVGSDSQEEVGSEAQQQLPEGEKGESSAAAGPQVEEEAKDVSSAAEAGSVKIESGESAEEAQQAVGEEGTGEEKEQPDEGVTTAVVSEEKEPTAAMEEVSPKTGGAEGNTGGEEDLMSVSPLVLS